MTTAVQNECLRKCGQRIQDKVQGNIKYFEEVGQINCYIIFNQTCLQNQLFPKYTEILFVLHRTRLS